MSSSCWYSPSENSASTPSIGLRGSERLGLGAGDISWGFASSCPRVGSSFIFCTSMQAGASLVFLRPRAPCLEAGPRRAVVRTRAGVPFLYAVPRAATRSGQVLSPPHRLRQPRRDDHWLGHPCAGFRNDTDRPSSCQAEKLCFHRITTPPREELAALGQRPIEGLEQALVLAARANG